MEGLFRIKTLYILDVWASITTFENGQALPILTSTSSDNYYLAQLSYIRCTSKCQIIGINIDKLFM